ncbi:uncharacterized protein [Temnothorax longispinosus]|uniref:uncharacterized protein n=1 Tax=Temnothorax longispinosus TaxID=300112 RepID=UPI003A98F862
MDQFEQIERDLLELSDQVATLGEFFTWTLQCAEFIEQLETRCSAKRQRLSDNPTIWQRQSLVARIARLEGVKLRLEKQFIHSGGDYANAGTSGDTRTAELVWREIDTAFKKRIMTGAVINIDHVEPRQFLGDACNVVCKRVRDIIKTHNCVKVNTLFNGEFVAGDKRDNKSFNTNNIELCGTSHLREWYELHVIEPTLAKLEEFQERDSGWALTRILNLTVSVNKYNPLRAGCHMKLPKDIKLKNAVINVLSMDNVCFAWSVVAALHSTERHSERESSYPHYSTVLNVRDIEFPMTLSQIKKFERLNNISVNVYTIEGKKTSNVLPIRLTDHTNDNHVNLLYVQEPRDNNVGHFAWIKHLSRLVSSQINKHGHTKYICDRCLHYFSSSDKLQSHTVECQKVNKCAIRLTSENNKWLSFKNHSRKERLPFVVYADLECVLQKTQPETEHASYAYQHHRGYDAHFIIKDIAAAFEGSIDVLPITKENFLTGETVSESDYAHATNVWQRFFVRTLGEYSDLYLKTDVLRLADVFENFRDSCVASYGLDPAYYYTLPGFTWDAMLKHTCINFELLTDVDMVMFIERGIRGGLSQCSGRYAKANNKYMESYDSSKPSSYLMYFDVNNLYGWAMCKPLPYAEFRWVEDSSNFDVNAIALDSSTGYILEVDLKYPQDKHDAHADLPFCPMRDKPPGKRQDKLLATLHDKERYVIHYRNLQQCMRHVTKWKGRYGAEAMIARPNFHSNSVFSENLLAIELRKLEVKFDKPIYVGM